MDQRLRDWVEIAIQWVEKCTIKGQINIDRYDNQGIIVVDKIPCGKSVTRVYYCDFLWNLRRKMHKNRLQCSTLDHSFSITTVVTEKLHEYGWKELPQSLYGYSNHPTDEQRWNAVIIKNKHYLWHNPCIYLCLLSFIDDDKNHRWHYYSDDRKIKPNKEVQESYIRSFQNLSKLNLIYLYNRIK